MGVHKGLKPAKTDCFAYNKEEHGCKALKELFCRKENCKFYKTKEELENGGKYDTSGAAV